LRFFSPLGAGATFVMEGFQLHFGWTCAPDDFECVPATQHEIDLDKGLINGLFGIGATFGALLNPYFAEKLGRRICLAISTLVFILGASIQTAAPEMWVMWLGRIFSGMGVGMRKLLSCNSWSFFALLSLFFAYTKLLFTTSSLVWLQQILTILSFNPPPPLAMDVYYI
jgi:MFS family permease